MTNETFEENSKKEEWGAWKIVSDMLSNPQGNGIYLTSDCYQKLYEFVVFQKEKARQEERKKILKILEDEIAITHTSVRGKTSGLTSAYMRIKQLK